MPIEIDPQASPPRTPASFLRTVLLRLMLVLIGVGVAVAIFAVLRGEPLGEALGKVLNTAMGTGLYAALALACADAAEKKPTLVSYAGILAACVGVAVFFVGIWFDQARYPWWWKTLAIATLYAVALWRAARFSLVELPGVAGAVVRVTSVAGIGIAHLVTIMILREEADPNLVRLMNALWILAIGGHVAVPILVKLRASKPKDPPAR